MKTLFRAIVVAAIAASIITRGVAQDTPPPAAPTNAAPETPAAPAQTKTAAPKKAPIAKKAAARPAPKSAAAPADVKSDPVLHPEPGIAKQNNVNVRGQAAINSEVIAHLQKNQPITLLEEITLKKAKQDEPARWYRIALPTNVGVWVHSSFVDTDAKTVKPRRLNVRSGPGENYSIVGRLEQGTVVTATDTKNSWLKIEPPTNSFGFVAAHLVERAPAAPVIVATPPPPAPTPTPTPEPVPVAPPPVVAEVAPATPNIVPAAPVTPPAAETPPVATPPPVAVVPAPAEVLPDTPIEKVKKVVSREGVLKGSVSIQAPSHYELRSLDTGKTINYVFSPSTNLMLKEFRGKRIVVTGEELLDERWQNTPVIIIDSFEVVP